MMLTLKRIPKWSQKYVQENCYVHVCSQNFRLSNCSFFFGCGGAIRTADFTIHDNQSIISEGGHAHIRDAPIIVWSSFRFWARSIRRIFLPKKSKHDIKWLMWEERDWGFPSTFLGPKGFLRLLSRGVVALWRGVERKDVMTCDACIHINLCWRICANISISTCISWRFMYIYISLNLQRSLHLNCYSCFYIYLKVVLFHHYNSLYLYWEAPTKNKYIYISISYLFLYF